ncbi:hypothetical protein F3Y22_tig00116937pilonHSYRG00065 [Hibiscus syriacus]|uniref:1-phosphatidylinositol-4-phosphate 5-kinase n=1 Tax=Hibiscus syriacus TaxID=106335 RepID=A0A6A2WMA6_HIBSY|nr:hypothetical protein F3Y22_tig00116937pilonHSYRG00065 [Hibiscus syriacus]
MNKDKDKEQSGVLKAWEATMRKTHAAKKRANIIFGTITMATAAEDDLENHHDKDNVSGEPYLVEKILPNGDYYTGQFSWPSGATYEGEFKSGYIDGSVYIPVLVGIQGAMGRTWEIPMAKRKPLHRGVENGMICGNGTFSSEPATTDWDPRPCIPSWLIVRSAREKTFRSCRHRKYWHGIRPRPTTTEEVVDRWKGKYRMERPDKMHMWESDDDMPKIGKDQEKLYLGHKNYELMLNLQLGIRHSVGRPAPATSLDLKAAAFDPKEKFGQFRQKEASYEEVVPGGPADYMISICGTGALRELSSPGKSGSFFYLTEDDRYMIKTMKKSEVKVSLSTLKLINVAMQIDRDWSFLNRREPWTIVFWGIHFKEIGANGEFIPCGSPSSSEVALFANVVGNNENESTPPPEMEEQIQDPKRWGVIKLGDEHAGKSRKNNKETGECISSGRGTNRGVLRGRVLEHRSTQRCSPADFRKAVGQLIHFTWDESRRDSPLPLKEAPNSPHQWGLVN